MEKSSQHVWKGALPDMASGRGTLGGEIGVNGLLRAFWGHKMMSPPPPFWRKGPVQKNAFGWSGRTRALFFGLSCESA